MRNNHGSVKLLFWVIDPSVSSAVEKGEWRRGAKTGTRMIRRADGRLQNWSGEHS